MSIRKTNAGHKPKKGEHMSYDAIFKGSLKGPARPATMTALPSSPAPDGTTDAYFKDVFAGAVF